MYELNSGFMKFLTDFQKLVPVLQGVKLLNSWLPYEVSMMYHCYLFYNHTKMSWADEHVLLP